MLARVLAGKGAVYAAAALAALLAASALGWWAQVRSLSADLREARAEQRVTATERDAWQGKAAELAEANRATQLMIATLRAELAQAQGQARRLEAEGRRAIAAARADASAATQRLREFRARYERQRATPDCAGALDALQQHCTQFEGY